MKKYKAAIIGCGDVAGMYGDRANHSVPTHASAYNLCAQTTITGAMDTNQGQLNRFCDKWNIKNGYTDLVSMMDEQLPEIISICSPTEYHYKHFKILDEYPILAIFAEKPLSYDLLEAKEIVKLTNHIPVAINYFRRWNKDLQRLKIDLNNGLYGDVKQITAHYTKGLATNGSHLLDLFQWFFGEICYENTIKLHPIINKDQGADCLLSLGNGAQIFLIHVPELDYVLIEVEIVCECGMIKITQRGQEIQIYKKEKDLFYNVFSKLELARSYETDWLNCFNNVVDNIISAIEKGETISCTPEDALRVGRLCDKILKTDSKKRTKDLDSTPKCNSN